MYRGWGGGSTGLGNIPKRYNSFWLLSLLVKALVKVLNAWVRLIIYSARWSFSFILGPLHWSSNWQWQPCIASCRLFWTLLWTVLADFVKKICKTYLLYSDEASKFVWCGLEGFTPLKQQGKLTPSVFSEFIEELSNFWKFFFYCWLDLLIVSETQWSEKDPLGPKMECWSTKKTNFPPQRYRQVFLQKKLHQFWSIVASTALFMIYSRI